LFANRGTSANRGVVEEALDGVVRVGAPRLQSAQPKRSSDRRKQRKAARRGSRREQRSDCAKLVQG